MQDSAARASLTWSGYLLLPEDDRRELVDGRLVEVEVPTKIHEWIVMCLGSELLVWTRRHGGIVLGSAYKVRIDDRRAVMPDLQFYRAGREHVGGETGLEAGAPDLVIEVLSVSSRTHDRVRKLNWYAAIGTPEYWLVDPEARTLERLILDAGSFRIAEAVEGSSAFAPASFPGLSIDLSRLWTIPGAQRAAAGQAGEPEPTT